MATVTRQIAFLRNKKLHKSKKEAIEGMKELLSQNLQDGSAVLARYVDKGGNVNTIFGVVYSDNDIKTITVFNGCETITLNDNKSSNLFYEDFYKLYDDLDKLCKSYSSSDSVNTKVLQ